MSLSSLPSLAPDRTNRVSDNAAAAALGKALFFDTRLSANGAISCASCHKPDRQFQDGLPVGQGMSLGNRRTMPIEGAAYFPFLFWDGRKDSLWSQALGPLENPAEHGADRTMVVRLALAAYKKEYEALFGPAPDLTGTPDHAMPNGEGDLASAWNAMSPKLRQDIDRAYVNIGKSIAAFERTLGPEPTRFDAFADALAQGKGDDAQSILTPTERAGLKLFIGKANCVSCHNGPLLTDNAFHNLGLPGATADSDAGRSAAVVTLKADPFNCLGEFSDAGPGDCSELRFMETSSPDLVGGFRSPSLRGAGLRAPYMHAGQFATLSDVVAHYNKAAAANFGTSELKPLGLTQEEVAAIESFLKTLDPAKTPSGEVGG
jgi:cytochrome c peroxidase